MRKTVYVIICILFCQVSMAETFKSIIDIENGIDINKVRLNDAKMEVVNEGKNNVLKIELGHMAFRPSVFLPLTNSDFSKHVGIAMDITNNGDKRISIEAQCYNENDQSLTIENGAMFYYRSMIVLEPGETDSLLITLSRPESALPSYVRNYLKNMFGLPGGYVFRRENLDLTKLSHISIFKQRDEDDYTITVGNIRAVGEYKLPDEETLKKSFFPFVDKFGQYKHNEWPNKVKSISDIKKQQEEETADLAANPGPASWNKYGSWEAGPTLEATGHFRVTKHEGKWWLVDPVGKLFWSHGINIVTTTQYTSPTGREHYFEEIHPRISSNFYRVNLWEKYPENCIEEATKVVHQRLRSWGVNTIADNSDREMYSQQKTPYTVEIRSGIAKTLPSSINEANFRKEFKDKLLSDTIYAFAAKDPWCVGFFIDNELLWPTSNKQKVIDSYFKVIYEVIKEFAPDKLYLGCRINSRGFDRTAFEACAKYCDVISINHYDFNISDFTETEDWDKPLIIGEFHFGALDAGAFHPGLRSVSNQKQRGRVYRHFVEQALASPYFVGTHWFQFVDQVCTARADGENYQIGFVDICDRPYPDMVKATRELSTDMYAHRFNLPTVNEEDVSGSILNRSFEEGSYTNSSGYLVPNNWILEGDIAGADVTLKNTNAHHGTWRYYIWATAGTNLDFYQDITLPAGTYTLKAATKPKVPGATSLYVNNDAITSQVSAEGNWDGEWRSTIISFTVPESNTNVRIGVTSTAAFMLDNFRLAKVDSNSVVSVSETPVDNNIFNIYVCNSNLIIEATQDARISIYSIDGRVLRKVLLKQGVNTVSGLSKGIYIVGKQKIVI